MSWLAWQNVMVVSGNAGRNFSPPRPPCPVTTTLTHHPNCFAPCFFRRFAARLAYCCPASFWFSIPPIAFAHRSTHAFAHCFCSTLLNLAPPFRPLLCSSHSLLASSLTFTPLLIIIFTNKQILHRGKLHQGLCEDDDRREINIGGERGQVPRPRRGCVWRGLSTTRGRNNSHRPPPTTVPSLQSSTTSTTTTRRSR